MIQNIRHYHSNDMKAVLIHIIGMTIKHVMIIAIVLLYYNSIILTQLITVAIYLFFIWLYIFIPTTSVEKMLC
jgi:uncharacterized BrkB/YihY/UPF0761 family membrane protein